MLELSISQISLVYKHFPSFPDSVTILILYIISHRLQSSSSIPIPQITFHNIFYLTILSHSLKSLSANPTQAQLLFHAHIINNNSTDKDSTLRNSKKKRKEKEGERRSKVRRAQGRDLPLGFLFSFWLWLRPSNFIGTKLCLTCKYASSNLCLALHIVLMFFVIREFIL